MTWGVGPWGAEGPWGTGVTIPAPILSDAVPSIIESEGGTLVTISGEHFRTTMTVDVLQNTQVVANGLIAFPSTDVRENYAIVAMPALEPGIYDLRVTTEGGDSSVLEGALDAREHAYEYKIESVRRKWAPVWAVGPRILTR